MKRLLRYSVTALALCITVVMAFNYWLINRTLPTTQQLATKETVLYFGYGSNMPTRYLANIRHVLIIESHAGMAKDYAMQFSSSSLWFEPAFANIYQSNGTVSYGVLHRISRADLDRITRSEGSNYSLELIEVDNLTTGSQTDAWTLVGDRQLSESNPSQRYLDWLLEGAREHGLPEDYIDQLAHLNGFYVPILSECVGSIIHIMVALTAR